MGFAILPEKNTWGFFAYEGLLRERNDGTCIYHNVASFVLNNSRATSLYLRRLTLLVVHSTSSSTMAQYRLDTLIFPSLGRL